MSVRRHAQATRWGAVAGAFLLVAMTWVAGAWTSSASARADEAHARAAASCNGLPLTLEGAPGETVLGTAGNDVLVTRGAARVDTGAGDDSICVTGRGTVVVTAGSGDDFVGGRAHKGKAFVSLGFGDDVFLGGDGVDRVWSQEASNQTSSDDGDFIDTGDGDDYVISGSSAAPNIDTVFLGAGDDELLTYGVGGEARLSGGPGTNTLRPLPGAELDSDWTFDNVTGQAVVGQEARLSWQSFQRFDLTGLHGPRVRFLGSRASEWVTAGGTCRAVLRGRAGDDRLKVETAGCNSLPAGDARLMGGPGDDQLTGSLGDDVLRGGAGRDTGDGGLGTDTCLVEQASGC